MQIIKQSMPIAARRRIFFEAVSISALQTRLTGLSGFTKRWKKAGVANAAGAGADPSEEDSTNLPGIYYYEPTLGEIDTAGPGLVRISNGAGVNQIEPRSIPFLVQEAFFGNAVTGTLGASAFSTNLVAATADFWKNTLITWLTGALTDQVQKVSGYAVSGGVISVAAPFTGAPANGDIFELLFR